MAESNDDAVGALGALWDALDDRARKLADHHAAIVAEASPGWERRAEGILSELHFLRNIAFFHGRRVTQALGR